MGSPTTWKRNGTSRSDATTSSGASREEEDAVSARLPPTPCGAPLRGHESDPPRPSLDLLHVLRQALGSAAGRVRTDDSVSDDCSIDVPESQEPASIFEMRSCVRKGFEDPDALPARILGLTGPFLLSSSADAPDSAPMSTLILNEGPNHCGFPSVLRWPCRR